MTLTNLQFTAVLSGRITVGAILKRLGSIGLFYLLLGLGGALVTLIGYSISALPLAGTIQHFIRDSIAAVVQEIGIFLPNLLGAIAILLIGWIVARISQLVVKRGLKLVEFTMLAKQAGIDGFLEKGGVKQSSSDLLATLVYWLVMLIVLVTALNVAGLEGTSQLLNEIVLYIPNIIVAIIVVVVGLYAASFVAALVRTVAANAGIEEAGLVAGLARYALIVFSFAIALNQLRIGEGIVANGFLLLFGAACLAGALSVGLGAREFVARYLRERFGKK